MVASSLLSGQSARSAASTSADAQLRAAQMAADAARFRPVGVTTRFGTSQFQFSPEGYVSGAGYTVSPELKAYQDRLMGLAGGGLSQAEQAQAQFAPLTGAAQGLFNLGQQYLAKSPEQVAADYIALFVRGHRLGRGSWRRMVGRHHATGAARLLASASHIASRRRAWPAVLCQPTWPRMVLCQLSPRAAQSPG